METINRVDYIELDLSLRRNKHREKLGCWSQSPASSHCEDNKVEEASLLCVWGLQTEMDGLDPAGPLFLSDLYTKKWFLLFS